MSTESIAKTTAAARNTIRADYVAIEAEDGITARITFDTGGSVVLVWRDGWRFSTGSEPALSPSVHHEGPAWWADALGRWFQQAAAEVPFNLSVAMAAEGGV